MTPQALQRAVVAAQTFDDVVVAAFVQLVFQVVQMLFERQHLRRVGVDDPAAYEVGEVSAAGLQHSWVELHGVEHLVDAGNRMPVARNQVAAADEQGEVGDIRDGTA